MALAEFDIGRALGQTTGMASFWLCFVKHKKHIYILLSMQFGILK
jgi:hypothetical protein